MANKKNAQLALEFISLIAFMFLIFLVFLTSAATGFQKGWKVMAISTLKTTGMLSPEVI